MLIRHYNLVVGVNKFQKRCDSVDGCQKMY
jgi:hypothetical protein